MKKSDTIGELATALALAQSEFPVIPKLHVGKITGMGKSGPYEYSYNYADLADTVAAVEEILAKNNLAVSQFPDTDGTNDLLTTLVMHASGEWLEASMRLNATTTPQAQGSAITYARRYALCSALGIIADEDDDGAVATSQVTQQVSTTRREAPQRSTAPSGDVVYLTVPFKDKDAVKALKARWDPDAPVAGSSKKGRWYIPPGMDPEPFNAWRETVDPQAAIAAVRATFEPFPDEPWPRDEDE